MAVSIETFEKIFRGEEGSNNGGLFAKFGIKRQGRSMYTIENMSKRILYEELSKASGRTGYGTASRFTVAGSARIREEKNGFFQGLMQRIGETQQQISDFETGFDSSGLFQQFEQTANIIQRDFLGHSNKGVQQLGIKWRYRRETRDKKKQRAATELANLPTSIQELIKSKSIFRDSSIQGGSRDISQYLTGFLYQMYQQNAAGEDFSDRFSNARKAIGAVEERQQGKFVRRAASEQKPTPSGGVSSQYYTNLLARNLPQYSQTPQTQFGGSQSQQSNQVAQQPRGGVKYVYGRNLPQSRQQESPQYNSTFGSSYN